MKESTDLMKIEENLRVGDLKKLGQDYIDSHPLFSLRFNLSGVRREIMDDTNKWIKVNRKRGVTIRDITQDLDVRCEKPDWVYLTENQIRQSLLR